jgi:FKBP-type peptidyl-prolyl cis-trans isomerase SlyD
MRVQADSVVTIDYRVEDSEGRFIASSDKDGQPLVYLHGHNNIVSGLEAFLQDKEEGEEGVVMLKADQAYGVYDPNLVLILDASKFPEGQELREGDQVQGTRRMQNIFGIVKKIDEQGVHLDTNHPLAGRDLLYRVCIRHIRLATEVELSIGEPDTL